MRRDLASQPTLSRFENTDLSSRFVTYEREQLAEAVIICHKRRKKKVKLIGSSLFHVGRSKFNFAPIR